MLTPKFSLSQTPDHIVATMQVLHIKASALDISIDQHTFIISAHPYFLRLEFTKAIIEDGTEKAELDISKDILTVWIPKATKGEEFTDLQLLTKLMGKAEKQKQKKPLIEELSPEIEIDTEQESEELETPLSANLSGFNYGFNKQYSGYFIHDLDELHGVVEMLENHETKPETSQQIVNVAFDQEHYMADFMEDQVIQELVSFKCFSSKSLDIADQLHTLTLQEFTPQQQQSMQELKRRKFLTSKDEANSIWLHIVDFLLAYCYEYRTTAGEFNVESCWTISKLSATLVAYAEYDNMQQVVYSFLKRSLSYPLYRSFALSKRCIKDVWHILRNGRNGVLAALLDIYYLFQRNSAYKVFNDIWVHDLCVWLQEEEWNEFIKSATDQLRRVKVEQNAIGWDLEELERAAKQVAQEIDR